MNGPVAKMVKGHIIHIVSSHIGFEKIRSNHGIEEDSLQFDAVSSQDKKIILNILTYFRNISIFEQGGKDLLRILPGKAVRCKETFATRHRNIPCDTSLKTQGD